MSKYQEWINKNVPKSPNKVYGKCDTWTNKMRKAFPELKKVRGFYHCPLWNKREHWWLKDKNNNIIDPTKHQFPSKGIGEYEEWIEGSAEPTGKCRYCGEYVFPPKWNFCCLEHEKLALRDINNY